MYSADALEGDALVRALSADVALLRVDIQRLGAGPALLVSRQEAAARLSVSLSHFKRAVQPHLRLVRSGGLRLVPVSELERWVVASMDR
jgi:excisionase family DNA binding protein